MVKIKGLYCTDDLLKRFKLLSVQNDKKMIDFLEDVIIFLESVNKLEKGSSVSILNKKLKIE
jgi:hypothetical protein